MVISLNYQQMMFGFTESVSWQSPSLFVPGTIFQNPNIESVWTPVNTAPRAEPEPFPISIHWFSPELSTSSSSVRWIISLPTAECQQESERDGFAACLQNDIFLSILAEKVLFQWIEKWHAMKNLNFDQRQSKKEKKTFAIA